MEASPVVSMTPWISVISQCIGWTFFLIAASMFKNFISHGLSIAIAEYLLKYGDEGVREKMLKWFADPEVIVEHLKSIEEKLEAKKLK